MAPPLHYTILPSPAGTLHAAFSATGLLRLAFGGHTSVRAFVARLPQRAQRTTAAEHPLAGQLADELDAYFAGDDPPFRIPLDLGRATAFQQAVWAALRAIPFGQTTGYGHVARSLGKPRAARAVGQAVGANPVLLVVPCHRVVCSSGALGGFSSGLPLKRWLLDHEQRH